MDSVIIHIRLLFIQPDGGKIQTDILTCHGVSITHELFQIAKISFYVAKLSAECAADFLCRALPALSKCIPWDTVSQFDPAVIRIHVETQRLVEIKEGML